MYIYIYLDAEECVLNGDAYVRKGKRPITDSDMSKICREKKWYKS
jgi:hypothetical protein